MEKNLGNLKITDKFPDFSPGFASWRGGNGEKRRLLNAKKNKVMPGN